MTRIPFKLCAVAGLFAAVAFLTGPSTLRAQKQQIVLSDQEKAIVDQIRKLRSLPDDERVKVTKRLAMEIRQLPPGSHKLGLADSLANLATEGDAGPETLQEVATTLGDALRAQPGASPGTGKDPSASSYATLAALVKYEHVQVSLDDPRFAAAKAKLEEDDRSRQSADFTLRDLTGKRWTLQKLRGSVVLVNFWATWCPPCRKEMPDMQALYQRFAPKGLVILAISDEDVSKVEQFIADHHFSYPILLDPGRKVNELFRVEGIPKSFVYDRDGKLVAEAIDMRTERQLLEMLAHAGLE